MVQKFVRPQFLALALACGFAGMTLAPTQAKACGGTFCDGGQGMPVDQTGENILFVIDATSIEAHIQIQYDPETDADNFAWLVPLTSVPEFSVGSEPLFQALLTATVPTYGLNSNPCMAPPPNGTGDGFSVKFDSNSPTPPDILFQDVVGAFEVTVLSDDSAADVMLWLGENGYTQDPAAEPIIQEYLDEGHLFAAFKLHHEAGVSDIHPVVLRFTGDEPCVPLRLTRIAAADNMRVRAFFLGTARTVPTNYRHVLVNPLKLDWLNFADNYIDVITQAVDAFQADGRAFVTEYAGDAGVVQTAGVYQAEWNAEVFVGLSPVEVVDTLVTQGLANCFEGQCFNFFPLVEGLLHTHLPVPDGLTAEDFYGCLSCFEDQIDLEAWGDGSGFANDLGERVVAPGLHAATLLQTWPYLTRLFTTISGHEMTEDPMFQQNPSLADIANIRTATQDFLCGDEWGANASVVTLPDGREVFVPDGSWPEFPDEMPWALEVQQTVLDGAPQVLVDHAPIIDDMLAAHNAAYGWPPEEGTTGGTGTTTGEPGGPWSGSDSGTSTGDATAGQTMDSSGCGCRTTTGWAWPAWALAGFWGVMWRRRRS